MTFLHISLIESSFEKLKPVAGEAGLLFYQHLFTVNPSLRRLIRTTLEEESQECGKLVQNLGMAVTALKHLDTLAPVLESMGRRQAANGIREKDYQTIGECLLWTLELELGAEFSGEVQAAWSAAYEILTGVMKRGAMAAVAA